VSDWTKDYGEFDPNIMRKLENDIWEGMAVINKSNEIGTDIDTAIALIEEICNPVLRWVDN
jgi:hypothetical protein